MEVALVLYFTMLFSLLLIYVSLIFYRIELQDGAKIRLNLVGLGGMLGSC